VHALIDMSVVLRLPDAAADAVLFQQQEQEVWGKLMRGLRDVMPAESPLVVDSIEVSVPVDL
jgi:hypothetical protein